MRHLTLKDGGDGLIADQIMEGLIMKDYVISYTHSLGFAEIRCYSWEIASILFNMAVMAINGHSFGNVTINRV